LLKIIIKEENFEWHLEAFASELFIWCLLLWCNSSGVGHVAELCCTV